MNIIEDKSPSAETQTESQIAQRVRLVRRLIGGAKAEIDMPVTGIKPIPMHAFWPLGVTTAVIAGRVRDRLGV